MLRVILCLAAIGGLWLASPAPAIAADPTPGNWKLTYAVSPAIDYIDAIVKLAKKDGNWSAESVANSVFARTFDVESVKVEGNTIHVAVKKNGGQYTFIGKLGDAKSIVGNYGNERLVYPAKLIWTEDEKIVTPTIRKDEPQPLKELDKIRTSSMPLRIKINQTTDPEEKKKLLAELKTKLEEIKKEVAAKSPGFYRAVIKDYSDSPAALDAALALLQQADKSGATPADVKSWVGIALKKAEVYGKRFEIETEISLAEKLCHGHMTKAACVELAKNAEAALGAHAPDDRVVRVLVPLVEAMGADPAAKPYAERLDKLERKLDEQYLAKHAKVEVKKYEGRKDGGSKTVVMELFTGAQCPPCVAADVAFDRLADAYKDTDVILLQYHLHIPGPDPLTNTGTESRAEYYKVHSTPSTFFNGKAAEGGGGNEARAPVKLDAYRKVIDPILDEKTDAKLTVKAVREGDVIKITAAASNLPDSGEHKLHCALVEESVRYQGGNGLRFHHHVVRSLPGGAAGQPLAGKSESRQMTVNLAELRGKLTKYLDDFAADRAFPKPQRPMDLKHLKIVTWVQDNGSHEIIAATESNVTDGAAG